MLCSPLAVQPSLFTQFFVINCRVRDKVKHIQTVLGDWLQKFKNTFISSRARPRYAERLRDKQYFRINFRIRELTWRTFPVRQALHFPWALAISERFIITKVTRHHCCKVSFYHYGEGFNKVIFKQEGIRIWQPGRKSTKLVGLVACTPENWKFYSCRDGFSCNSNLSFTYVFFRNFVIFKDDLMQNIGLFNASMGGFAHNLKITRTHKIVVSST